MTAPSTSRIAQALAFGLALGLGRPLEAADPPYYRREPAWHTSLLASLAARDAAQMPAAFTPFESDRRRGGQSPIRISVVLSNATSLFLQVVGDPDKIWGVADWAEPFLIDGQGQRHPFTTAGREQDGKPALDWTVLKGRHEINLTLHSGLYEPLRLAGHEFARGIHVQADSLIQVTSGGPSARFEAVIGVDDWAGTNGHVRFRVLPERAAALEGLWDLLERDFPHAQPRREMRWEQLDRIWSAAWERLDLPALARQYAHACEPVPPLQRQAAQAAQAVRTPADLVGVRELYLHARELRDALDEALSFDHEALHLTLQCLVDSYGSQAAPAAASLVKLPGLRSQLESALARATASGATLADFAAVRRALEDLRLCRNAALLAHPRLLDAQGVLVVKRRPVGDPRRSQWADRGLGEYIGLPRQSSWALPTMPRTDDWENEIAVVPLRTSHPPPAGEGSSKGAAEVQERDAGALSAESHMQPPQPPLQPLYRRNDRRLITDVDLHWDADRLLFSMPDAGGRWQVHELRLGDTDARQLTPSEHPDVHHYDSCYLPSGRIAFMSTAPLQGVPCNAGVIVGMMYLMDADGGNIEQVCFEQDHDYTPSVLNNGRILYLRWDYTDTPHVWNRLLMHMNPDGTGQSEYYGSGSYWPNAMFFSRAVPGHASMIATIVTGHHEGRVGELVLLDPARGRHETEGVVQKIPGRNRPVRGVIEDKPTEHSWPKFLHPWPLDDHYLLVACKPQPDALWGIYLVDTFDNLILLREEEEYALLEPIPLQRRPRPPIIPSKVKPQEPDATVYLEDIYRGPGLRDVPRGTVKQLRLFTYHFGYQKLAGIDHRVGTDGPWEIKHVLGTVPVRPDGSALFKVPAKTPLSLQPLDGSGQALALMRSWLTAQPGEVLSCVGCHERQGTAPPNRHTLALRSPPTEIRADPTTPRGFGFARDVQPVLDRLCIGCHTGETDAQGRRPMDLRATPQRWVVYEHGNPDLRTVTNRSHADLLGRYAGVFAPAYVELRRFVRVGGLESDLHPLPPKEFSADTTELVQMLRKGHFGVQLDADAWRRLFTWIDLNAPCHGAWSEVSRIPVADHPQRRLELRRRYGGPLTDYESPPTTTATSLPPLPARANLTPAPPPKPVCPDWPWSPAAAQQRQQALGSTRRTLDLGNGLTLELVRIPPGRFVMGDPAETPDEGPPRAVEIARPFWMAIHEVTNEQFQRFDPDHDSRFEHRSSWIFDASYLGWPLNRPRQPVVRVSWQQAMAFCVWLSKRTGCHVTLPTETEWEYACRAGTDSPLNYGSLQSDFSQHANLADVNLRRLATEGWRPRAPDLVPRIDTVNDGELVTAEVGRYVPNAWGLFDMHGNASEWTRSAYHRRAGSEAEADEPAPDRERVVRGGSWRDRPARARSAFRLPYPAYQRVFNVGFRVLVEDGPANPPSAGQPEIASDTLRDSGDTPQAPESRPRSADGSPHARRRD